MQKIKISFTKVLPFVFIFQIVLMTASNITNRFSHMVIINAESPAWNGITAFLNIVITVAVSPLHIGFYKFCFERVNGGKPYILTVFDFYRSAGKIFKSVIAVNLGTIASKAFFSVMSLTIFNVPIGAGFAGFFIHLALSWIIMVFFLCMPYLYAKDEGVGIGTAMKLSFKLGLKYMIIFVAVNAVTALPEILYTVASFTVQPDKMLFTDYLSLMGAGFGIGRTLMRLIENVFAVWVEFTAVWCIFERERDKMLKDFFAKFKNGNGSEEVPENAGDTPFIEPYDFCIEADERFHDEKVIETEDIRGVDILAALEEMNLAFDVVNHFGIRRKLKRMFDDLAFEIDEFVTYEGGRSIENSFTEEIDDREFEVFAEISKASDYEPFKLTLSVNISDNEEE